eukprot:TRINITY_DN5953_c0_g1_i2.p1 TRINITY_DN5953_c0_g1~~TRINITY_DN5953_c0_g1_i2.p1  ORF type:complete len:949 (-),score=329.99 TRINITY_DN5953_c0_g1_i2:128-2974(-)
MKESKDSPYTEFPFPVAVQPFLPSSVEPSYSQWIREEALKVLVDIGKSSPQAKQDVLMSLARFGADYFAFDTFWSLGGSNAPEPVAVLIERCYAYINKDSSTMPRELSQSLHQAIRKEDVSLAKDSEMLAKILNICTQLQSEYKNEGTTYEYAQETLELLDDCIAQAPNDPVFLNIALNPLTLESLDVVAGQVGGYSTENWLNILLPFINGELNKMQLAGVSGDQLEQQVIDLLRECARIFYINQDVSPSAELGKSLFLTILEAMRHGYVETERFSELGAKVISHHVADNSATWIAHALTPRVCHRHMVTRAIGEMIFQLLGIESTATYSEVPQVSDAQQTAVLQVVATTASIPAYALFEEIALMYGSYISSLPHVLRMAVDNMSNTLHQMLNDQAIDYIKIQWMNELIRALALRVTPDNAAALFELALQTMSLSPQGHTTSYSDETMTLIISKVPAGVPLQLNAVQQALATGGPETRFALTEFVPHLCLLDEDPTVRAQAMRVLKNRPEMLAVYANQIILSCSPQKVEHEDGDLYMHDNEMAHASAPLLSRLAIVNPSSLDTCIRMLIEAASISATNDPENIPSEVITKALGAIAQDGNAFALIQFLNEGKGTNLIGTLTNLSSEWSGYVEELEVEGILSKKLTGGYSVNKSAVHNATLLDVQALMNRIEQMYANGQLMQSLRACNQLRTRSPEQYADHTFEFVTKTLLPEIARRMLPIPRRDSRNQLVFEDVDIDAYESTMSTMSEIRALFPEESEQVLFITQRINDLNLGVVQQRYLSIGNNSGAMRFMRDNGIHDPNLVQVIENAREFKPIIPTVEQSVADDYQLGEALMPSTANITLQVPDYGQSEVNNNLLESSNGSNNWDPWEQIKQLKDTSNANSVELQPLNESGVSSESSTVDDEDIVIWGLGSGVEQEEEDAPHNPFNFKKKKKRKSKQYASTDALLA